MDKIGSSSADLWLPYLLMVLLVATGVVSTPRGPTAIRPGVGDLVSEQTAREWQNVAARLWQDPLEATEAVRKAVANHDTASAAVRDMIPLEQLVTEHSYKDGKLQPDGKIDYVTGSHRVLYLFVSLPSEAYPEASEQRIRTRVAIVSALSTAGYRPANAARLGVARWDANIVATENSTPPPVTSQLGYPFEIFVFDAERKVLYSSEKLARKFDEAIVFYVEEASLQVEQQFEWLKRLSKLLASSSPPDRFAKKGYILSRWIGPSTSERLVALLRAAGRDLAKNPPDAPPAPTEALPIKVVAVLPTIEPAFTNKIVRSSAGDDEPLKLLANESPPSLRAQFVNALEDSPHEIPLAQRNDATNADTRPWITLERLGCDDGLLATALVRELKLRRPALFDPDRPVGTVALISEWDTLYGRALPESFEEQFFKAGGRSESVRHFTYLRGLDGQIAGVAEKPKTEGAVHAPDSVDVLRQLMKSRAPSISFGRTQVDYVDRLAAKLQISQRAQPNTRLEAVGILGSDTYDKLLILQGLRKVFPSVEYFTTDLDASLFAPEQYDVTRNLLVASAFQLELTEGYQKSILPFRDSAQTSIYFATLHATEYFNMKKNVDIGKPFPSWVPAIFEIGRSGPYPLVSNPRAGGAIEQKVDPPAGASEETATFRSPLAVASETALSTWRREIVPLAALAVIVAVALTQFGREAFRRIVSLTKLTARQFAQLATRHHKSTTWRRLGQELRGEIATSLLIVAALFFLAVAARMPWIAEKPNQEPFLVFEGISSWPTTWLRALTLFLCACYFWIIALQFRRALAAGHRELARTAPEGCPPPEVPSRPTPCQAWDRFCRRSRGWKIKTLILGIWTIYIGLALLIFSHLDPPALVTRGQLSMKWEKAILLSAVFSMNLLIVYAVVHNFSCAFFVRQVAEWLRQPDAPDIDCPPLHTALMRTIGLAAGAMTQMIYYPFTLIFLLIAARHPLFDNFDWPVGLIIVFLFSCTALLSSTLLVRRSADQARKNALAWLGRRIAILKWQGTGTSGVLSQRDERALARAEWQVGQIQEVGGPALSVGFLSNPLLRAVLIPIGGTGVLQLVDVAGKAF